MANKKHQATNDIALLNYQLGCQIVSEHPMFAGLVYTVR